MYLINDEEAYKLGVGSLATLPGDDIPLLRGCDDNVRLADLLPRKRLVPRKFLHLDAESTEADSGEGDEALPDFLDGDDEETNTDDEEERHLAAAE